MSLGRWSLLPLACLGEAFKCGPLVANWRAKRLSSNCSSPFRCTLRWEQRKLSRMLKAVLRRRQKQRARQGAGAIVVDLEQLSGSGNQTGYVLNTRRERDEPNGRMACQRYDYAGSQHAQQRHREKACCRSSETP